jgi:hypothetical protein
LAVAVLVASGLAASCRTRGRDPYLTYYGAEHAITVRYPATWKTDTVQQEGGWYRYFLAPPAGPERKPAVSVTMLATPFAGTLEAYAQGYVAGNTVLSTKDASRPGARGMSWQFASADGKTRYGLLLLQEGQKVYGLFSQGEAANFDSQRPVLEEMDKSLNLERPALYPEERNERFLFALRVPPSWKPTRSFSTGGGSFLQQYQSPPFGAEKDQTVHASLTLTIEDVPAGATLDSYYAATKQKLGETIQVLDHDPWGAGYVDVVHSETPVAVSRGKRYYRVAGNRGYILTLEAREDIYVRANRWCDLIAATLKVGPEVAGP